MQNLSVVKTGPQRKVFSEQVLTRQLSAVDYLIHCTVHVILHVFIRSVYYKGLLLNSKAYLI